MPFTATNRNGKVPERFLELPAEERSQALRKAAAELGRTARVLEKDVWVCWVLERLFAMPGRKQMAFKGGTSLSKVFGAIERFSEDVDVTLDYRSLDAGIDPFDEKLSRTRLKKYGETLKQFVRGHAKEVIGPYFENALAEFGEVASVEVGESGEEVRIHYPSAAEEETDYLASSVLIELGGRNITEPNESHEIVPDMTSLFPELEFPRAQADVLSPVRTFWEKATLIHAECNRGEFRKTAERLSRHWYDLAMLARHPIGEKALAQRELLEDVVRHKKVFFSTSHARYDECLTGGLRLVPEEDFVRNLRADFEAMVAAGMFYGEASPAFDEILERLHDLERAINGVIRTS